MKEEIWDGEMDYGWEDLAEKVRIVSNNFADVMLETVSFSPVVCCGRWSKNLDYN